MVHKERFFDLPEYPFSRLRNLLNNISPEEEPVDFSIGEPKHSIPNFVSKAIKKNTNHLNKYPPNFGSELLLNSISKWLAKRYNIAAPDPNSTIMALNGSREGIFNATLALCNKKNNSEKPIVLIPNPFYQCYLAAVLAADAEPFFVPATVENHFLPDFKKVSQKILNKTSIVFICSPSNPQGAIADLNYWKSLFDLAELYGFKIFSDECYSEIYREKKPIGILQATDTLGYDLEKVLSFNSLSKRSNLPGIRSGFVCGGLNNIDSIKKLRTYGGSPLPMPIQEISILAWDDETHVKTNLHLYREKYEIADKIFKNFSGYNPPEAGFFLWLEVGDGEKLTHLLWKKHGVKCLPGSFLSYEKRNQLNSYNLGSSFIRVALVNSLEKTTKGLSKIAKTLKLEIEEEIYNNVNC